MRRTCRNAAIAVMSLSAVLVLGSAPPSRAAAEACTGANKYLTRADTPKYVWSSNSSVKRMTFTYSEQHWPAGTCLTVVPAAVQKGKWVTAHDGLKLTHTQQAGFVAHPITFLQTTVQRGGTSVQYWLDAADVDPAL